MEALSLSANSEDDEGGAVCDPDDDQGSQVCGERRRA